VSKRKAEYTTRDPQPVNRDPVLVESPPEPHSPAPRQHPPIIRVEIPRCKGCGNGPWLTGGTTVPNGTSRGMLRWRTCAQCRKTHYLARPMTPEEVDRYCEPPSSIPA
jgi:hypothetical protein